MPRFSKYDFIRAAERANNYFTHTPPGSKTTFLPLLFHKCWRRITFTLLEVLLMSLFYAKCRSGSRCLTACSNTHANTHTRTHAQCLCALFVFLFFFFQNCHCADFLVEYWFWNNPQWTALFPSEKANRFSGFIFLYFSVFLFKLFISVYMPCRTRKYSFDYPTF